ncbi:hypothetical protein, partial [Kaistella sp.]|uniref:hypothetical protein n=1 Tax=Kaistella sp. TaxID=2782235 RepID=UPI003C3C8336
MLPFDTLRLSTAKDLLADDYGNIYLYQNKDFSFTKYDSLGNQKAKLMLTLPFQIQSVQNPLNIPSFSENGQELKFFDQNLNEIQSVNFRQKFGFIKAAFVEDLQQAWLLDDSTKRLIQYNFRDARVINTFPFNLNFDNIVDLLVFDKRIYFLYRNKLLIYNFKSEKIAEYSLENAIKLRRENERIFVISKNNIQKIEQESLKVIFSAGNAQIVDKNSASY